MNEVDLHEFTSKNNEEISQKHCSSQKAALFDCYAVAQLHVTIENELHCEHIFLFFSVSFTVFYRTALLFSWGDNSKTLNQCSRPKFLRRERYFTTTRILTSHILRIFISLFRSKLLATLCIGRERERKIWIIGNSNGKIIVLLALFY